MRDPRSRRKVRRLVRRSVAAGLVAFALHSVPGATALEVNPWFENPPFNIAHQGGEDEFPSNTQFAFHRAVDSGADMLELDIGVTKDDRVVVMHDTTVNRTTDGHGTIASKRLEQIKRLDGAYWFSRQGPDHYEHGRSRDAYRFRGIATGKESPPKGFKPADFRVPTLREVLKAFPRTPINIEIKARTKREETEEYVENAEVLADALDKVDREDLIVTSFRQQAVDRFHELLPRIDLAPGLDGAASWVFGGSPGPGVVAFQLPITYELGDQVLQVTSEENVARAHAEGYAWHNWFGSLDRDAPPTWGQLIDWCVDGIMTSRPTMLEKVLESHPPPDACPSDA